VTDLAVLLDHLTNGHLREIQTMGYENFQIFFFFSEIVFIYIFFIFKNHNILAPHKKHAIFPHPFFFTALTAFDDSDGTVLDYGEPLARGDS